MLSACGFGTDDIGKTAQNTLAVGVNNSMSGTSKMCRMLLVRAGVAGEKRVVMQKRSGFTLIELLVVISIVALLISILLPTLSKSKTQTKAVVCLSNIHEWALVWETFTGDNKDQFVFDEEDPVRLEWLEPLEAYYTEKDILLCPSATKPTEGSDIGRKFRAWTENEADTNVTYIGSYGINFWITHSTAKGMVGKHLWRTPKVKGAGYVPMFFDCAVSGICPSHTDAPPAYDDEVYISNPGIASEMKACCLNRHHEHINMALLDFSARRVGLKEMWELWWHRKWNPNNDPPPDWETEAPWMVHMKDYWVP